MIKFALLFDIDGVVAETPHEESWREAAIEWNLIDRDFNFKEFYQRFVAGIPGIKGAEIILEKTGYFEKKLITDASEKEKESINFRNKKQILLEKYIEEGKFRIFSDAIEIIKNARANEIPVAAVSSSENAEKILKKSGAYGLFDSHTLGAIKHNAKSKDELYLIAFGKLMGKLNLEYCPIPVVFEDADRAIIAAKKIGYKCVGIAREGMATIESLKAVGADLAYDEQLLKNMRVMQIIKELFPKQ